MGAFPAPAARVRLSARGPGSILPYLPNERATGQRVPRPSTLRKVGPKMGELGPNPLAFRGEPRYSLCSTGATASVLP